MNDLLLAVDGGDAVILALLDLSAAFDTIDHSILLNRMSVRFGISGCVLDWFRSYLCGRSQCISVSGVSSSPALLPYGVPQGSVLGPILFILYNSPLHDIASSHGIADHEYADDEQLYKPFRPSADFSEQIQAFSSLSDCITDSKVWAATNRLQFNDSKADAIVISSKSARTKPAPLPLTVGDVPINPSAVVRNLGVMVDSHLTMDDQIRDLCRKAFYQLSRIARIKRHLSPASITQLIHAFVLSHLDYGNALLAGATAGRLDRLQRVQNCAARLVTGTKKYESITPHLKSLHWLPVPLRIDFKIAVLCFQCVNGTAPLYLSELISLYSPRSSVTLRSSSTLKLKIPASRTVSYGDRAFAVYGPRLWNSLPPDIRCSQTLVQFKSRLKTHLF
jgi:hypothetical protein